MAHEMTLADLRTFVRAYFDLDVSDLPDTLIDRWVSEGWRNIVRFRPNWPGFEDTTSLVVVAGTHTYAMPAAIKDIISLEGPDRFLIQLSSEQAERRFIRGGILEPAGPPVAYSVFERQVRLWPTPSTSKSYTLRGYRDPVNPLTGGISDPIDLPHADATELLVSWLVHKAAIREAEAATAAAYLDAFTQGLQLLAKDETDTPPSEPIVLNSVPAVPTGLNTLLPDRLRFADGWE